MANAFGIHYQDAKYASYPFNSTGAVGSNSGLKTLSSALKHNPGISTDWSLKEQAILNAGLAQRSPAESLVTVYANISMKLPNKTVRDVALRCRWLTKKENSKRRKDGNLAGKGKEKMGRVSTHSTRTSQLMARPNVPRCTTLRMSADTDDDVPHKALSTVTRRLLDQNKETIKQISENFSTMQFEENTVLLAQMRDNILKIMDEIYLPEVMKQMPPLPVKLDEELTKKLLPPPNLPKSDDSSQFNCA
ncbi:hypothetical protein K2173_019278 [Erythroxylum novogranatense]|uniref:Uncharacterized protein n=1 Tax=Erythroxylum novogranatense TaxID=1862640 RepID=A0AAV8STW6_9ROSI|nr:hypothetical protein K2173_019278 [Erythroxylum novogranatense]